MGRQEADESDLLLRTLQGSSEKDIEEMLASPPALCIQNDAVCSGKSVAWHSQWTRSQRIRILSIAFVASLLSLSSCTSLSPSPPTKHSPMVQFLLTTRALWR